MGLVDQDDVVKALTTGGSNDTLSVAVLPRRSEAGWAIPNAHRPDPSLEDGAELHIIVADQKSRGGIPWKSFGNLLS